MHIQLKKEIEPNASVEKLVLKLGGDCNLSCKHCHCDIPKSYQLNPDVIAWIKSCPNLQMINFSGGEPLMFIDTIKQIVEELGDEYRYKLVTNGTLLDMDIVEFLNDNNFNVIISFDGKKSNRDMSILPRWEIARYLRSLSFSCYTSSSVDAEEIQSDINWLIYNYHLYSATNNGTICANFMHEIPGAEVIRSDEDVEMYLSSIQKICEKQLNLCMEHGGHHIRNDFTIRRCLMKWYEVKSSTYGVACASSKVVTVSLDGRFLACPYTEEYFGDIYAGFNVSKLEAQIPPKCKKCKIFDRCRNTCFKNITEHECIIAKRMFAFFKQLEKKYGIDFSTYFEKEYN